MDGDEEEIWIEILDIESFKKIVHTLNQFNALMQFSKTEAQIFREELVLTSSDKVKVYVRKIASYEYVVVATLLSDNVTKKDFWVHLDSIAKERNSRYIKPNHEVFSIVCLGDLYVKGRRVKSVLAK